MPAWLVTREGAKGNPCRCTWAVCYDVWIKYVLVSCFGEERRTRINAYATTVEGQGNYLSVSKRQIIYTYTYTTGDFPWNNNHFRGRTKKYLHKRAEPGTNKHATPPVPVPLLLRGRVHCGHPCPNVIQAALYSMQGSRNVIQWGIIFHARGSPSRINIFNRLHPPPRPRAPLQETPYNGAVYSTQGIKKYDKTSTPFRAGGQESSTLIACRCSRNAMKGAPYPCRGSRNAIKPALYSVEEVKKAALYCTQGFPHPGINMLYVPSARQMILWCDR